MSETKWVPIDVAGDRVAMSHLPDESRLYYEAHVTIPPLTAEQILQVDELCSARGWHRSTFELHKDGLVPNAFVSARDGVRETIILRVAEMVDGLESLGLEILRWKIEDTLLDSKRGDDLVLAPAQPASTASGPL